MDDWASSISCAKGNVTYTAELLKQLVATKKCDLLSLYSWQQGPCLPWALELFLSYGKTIWFTNGGKIYSYFCWLFLCHFRKLNQAGAELDDFQSLCKEVGKTVWQEARQKEEQDLPISAQQVLKGVVFVSRRRQCSDVRKFHIYVMNILLSFSFSATKTVQCRLKDVCHLLFIASSRI